METFLRKFKVYLCISWKKNILMINEMARETAGQEHNSKDIMKS